jgi:hypothetical protein
MVKIAKIDLKPVKLFSDIELLIVYLLFTSFHLFSDFAIFAKNDDFLQKTSIFEKLDFC